MGSTLGDRTNGAIAKLNELQPSCEQCVDHRLNVMP